MPALRVWVEGRVQGVVFRESTRQEARRLGLGGWVKNLPDGRVEAMFIGEKDACERALAFVSVGPPMAAVRHVRHQWEDTSEDVAGDFEIRF